MKDRKPEPKPKKKKTKPKIITNLIPENKPILCCFGFKPQEPIVHSPNI